MPKSMIRSLLIIPVLIATLAVTAPLYAQTPEEIPVLIDVTPDDGTTGIDPNTNFTLTFDSDVSVNEGDIVIIRVSDGTEIERIPVTSTQVSIDGPVATIDPVTLLNFSESYRVEFPENAFVVATPLVILSTNPEAGSINLALDDTIRVEFSRRANIPDGAIRFACGPSLSASDTTDVELSPKLPLVNVANVELTPDAGMLPAGARCRLHVDSSLITAFDNGAPLDDQGQANNSGVIFYNTETKPDAADDDYPEVLIGNLDIDSSLIEFSVFDNDAESILEVDITADSSTVCGGALNFNTNTGRFTYSPPVGYEGMDTFTYTVTTTGPNSRGSTGTGTVTFDIGDVVWFVDNTANGSNNGTLSDPYQSLADLDAINKFSQEVTLTGVPNCPGNGVESITPDAGDSIFLFGTNTDYQGPLLLRNEQTAIGQGSDDGNIGMLADRASGLTPAESVVSMPQMGGTAPTITAAGTVIPLRKRTGIIGVDVRIDDVLDVGIIGDDFGNVYFSDVNIGNDTLQAAQGRILDLRNSEIRDGSNLGNLQTSLIQASADAVFLSRMSGELSVVSTTVTSSTLDSDAIQVTFSSGDKDDFFNFGDLTINLTGESSRAIYAEENNDVTVGSTNVGDTEIRVADGTALQSINTDLDLNVDVVETQGSDSDGIGMFQSGGRLQFGETIIGTTTPPAEDGIQILNADDDSAEDEEQAQSADVDGDFDFGDVTISVAAEGAVGVRVGNSASKKTIISGGTVSSDGGSAISVMDSGAEMTFETLTSANSNGDGVLLTGLSGFVNVTGLTDIDNAGTNGIRLFNLYVFDALIDFGDVDVDGTINGDGINVENVFGPNVTMGNVTVDGSSDDGIQVANLTAGSVKMGDTTIGATTSPGTEGVDISLVIGNVEFNSLDVTTDNGTAFVGFNNRFGNLIIQNGTGSLNATNGGCVDINNPGGGVTAISLIFDSCITTDAPVHGIRVEDTNGGQFVINQQTRLDMAPNSLESLLIGDMQTQLVDISAGDNLTITDRARTGILIRNFGGTSGFFGTYRDTNSLNVGGGYGLRIENSTAPVTFDSTFISNTQTLSPEQRTDNLSFGFPVTDGDGDGIFITENAGLVTINGGRIENTDGDGIDHRNSNGMVLNNLVITDTKANGIRMYRPLTDTTTINNLRVIAGANFFTGFLLQQNRDTNAVVNVNNPYVGNNGSAEKGIWVQTYSGGGTTTFNVAGSVDPRPGSGNQEACDFRKFDDHSLVYEAGADSFSSGTSSTLIGTVTQCRIRSSVSIGGAGGDNNNHTLDMVFNTNYLDDEPLVVDGNSGLTMRGAFQANNIDNNVNTETAMNFDFSGNVTINTTVTANDIASAGDTGFNYELNGGTACLNVTGNTVTQAGSNDFRAAENSGTLTLQGPGTAVVTPNDLTVGLTNAALGSGNAEVVGSPTFNDDTSCTLPTNLP